MHILPCARALGICKNIGIRTYFGSATAEIMGFFRHFAFCSLGNRLASFVIVPKNCFVRGASFELINNLATLFPKKLPGFHETLLHHCYALRVAPRDPWGTSTVGLGSWSAFSRPSALIWYHERRAPALWYGIMRGGHTPSPSCTPDPPLTVNS